MIATLWIIALREARDQWTSRRMGLAGLVCAVLVMVSLALLVADYEERKRGFDQRDAAGQTRAGKRPKLSAPPTPLSILARGLEVHNGRLLFITWSQPRRQPGAVVMDQGDPNPLFELFRAPDLVHIVQYVLSLLALFGAYDAICGERVRGTLGLVFAGPVRRGVFVAGKALGLLLGQLAALVPVGVVAVGWLAFSPGLDLRGEDWVRVGGLMLFSLLYVALFVHMGLWASALMVRPASALMLLLGLWIAWGVGWPNLSLSLGRWLVPVASTAQIEEEKSALKQGDFDSYLDYANACWAIDDRYIAEVDAQTAFTEGWSRLSPLASYRYGTAALARTGVADYQRFRDAVVRWDRQQRRIGYNWQDEIPFDYSFQPLGKSWARAWPEIGMLVAWNAFFFAAGLYVFLRRDIS